MSQDSLRTTISVLQGEITKLQQEANNHKKTINSLCKVLGDAPLYADIDDENSVVSVVARRDEFYGKPLATVVRMILERRGKLNIGAASVPEIYEAMKAGGYNFTAKNDDNNKRVLLSAIAKNTATFHKLPTGTYGLREWYPSIKERPKPEAATSEDEKPLHEELQAEANREGTHEELEVVGTIGPAKKAK